MKSWTRAEYERLVDLGAFVDQPIELIGGALVALGLFTSWAAFLSSGLMAFAYFLGHAKDGFIPMVNKGELAVVYCFVFLYMAARGSGIWSVDAARKKS